MVNKEFVCLCKKKTNSLFRKKAKSLASFSWDKVLAELHQFAPVFSTIMKMCLHQKKRTTSTKGKSCKVDDKAVIGVCASIVLRHRNQNISLFQRVISLLLHSGHAPKKVYTRLQRILLCVSHKSTIRMLEELGEHHDESVIRWRDEIQNLMNSNADKAYCATGGTAVGHHNVPVRVDADNTSIPHMRSECEVVESSTSESTLSTASSAGSQSSSPYSAPSVSSIITDEEFPVTVPYHQCPSFKIVGDNIDKYVKPREMRFDAQAKSLNFFNSYAVLGRVDISSLDDQPFAPKFSAFHSQSLLPSKEDDLKLKRNMITLFVRTLAKHSSFFKEFSSAAPKHIKHQYYSEMSQKSEVVPFGILPKCETKHDEMISIMESHQSYIPSVSEEIDIDIPGIGTKTGHADWFHHVLFGGDMLTAKRARGSQYIRSNSTRGIERLEGLQAVAEDWHCKMCFLGVIWKRLYNCSSGKEEGTLYQLRCLINRRNVVTKPETSVTACEEFFLLVTEAHICALAMKVFGMKTLDDVPSSSHFPQKCHDLSANDRWKLMQLAVEEILDNHVDLSYPTAPVSVSHDKSPDHMQAYASELLSLGLLLMEFVDAVREGDGGRIIRCWRYFLPIFKVSGRKNYVIEAFNLLFKYEYCFTPRMKEQLLWERTINTHGRSGKNVSMDLHMEHINRACKMQMGALGPNTSEESIARIGKSINATMKMLRTFDKVNGVKQESEKHSKRSVTLDMDKLLTQLTSADVFGFVSNRRHKHFPNMQVNMTRKLSLKELDAWMADQVKKSETRYV